MAHPKELDPSESGPAFLGAHLREARTKAGLTQQELGERAYCSTSLIAMIERGERVPHPDRARGLDAALGTGQFFEHLSVVVRASRNLPDYYVDTAEHEASAESIREFSGSLIPGLLQVAEYAREIFRAAQPLSGAKRIEDLVATRMKRGRIFNHPTTPAYWAVLDEAALRRVVGGPRAMAKQLEHISRLACMGRILVQVIPFGVGAHAAQEGLIKLMEVPDEPPFAYVEGLHIGRLSDDPPLVKRCEASYDLAAAAALSPDASLIMLKSIAEEYANAR